MVIKTASPGVIVNEVDLTRGTSDAITTNVGALAGPFVKGPVDKITYIEQEVDLIDTFGAPTDANYEYFYSVDNFLEYGGTCYVVRCDDSVGGNQVMRNAVDGPQADSNGNEIVYYVKNEDDFEENFFNTDASQGGLPTKFIAANPGVWGNSLAVAVIDQGADFELTLYDDRQWDLNGAPVAVTDPVYFDKTVAIGTNLGTVQKVAATQEQLVIPPAFTDVQTALSANFDIIAGGVAAAITVSNSGTGYGLRTVANTELATAKISESDGGENLTLNVTIEDGALKEVVGIGTAGTGYVANQIVMVDGGVTSNGTAKILNVDVDGGVTAVQATPATVGQDYNVSGDGKVTGVPVFLSSGDNARPNGTTVSYTTTGGILSDVVVEAVGDAADGSSYIIIGGNKDAIFTLDATLDMEGTTVADGDRVLLAGQTDAAENGIYDANGGGTWTRSVDANNGSEFTPKKTVTVIAGDNSGTYEYAGADNPTVGSDNITFQVAVSVGYIGKGDFVTADPSGATGLVQTAASGQYSILTLSGTFVEGDTFSKDGGTNITGPITAADPRGQYVVYSYGATDALGQIIDERLVNIIFVPDKVSYDDGLERGWPVAVGGKQRLPFDGERATSATGDIYVWVARENAWVSQAKPQVGDFISDGTNVFEMDATDAWYDKQIAFAGIPWFRFASRPTTTINANDKGASNDEMHIIVYDANGDLTGSKGNVIESFYGVSKLRGAKTPEGDNNYYIDVLNRRSSNIFGNQDVDGPNLAQINEDFDLAAPGANIGDGVVSGYIDAKSYLLTGGVDNLEATLGELQNSYQKFIDENVEDMDYVLQGPSLSNPDDAIAKANFIISIAEGKKDCMAFISPPRYAAIDPLKADIITERVVEFYNELSSSSYAVFDSGYKYSYDRFNDKQRYVPLNGDIAGLLVNASLVAEPWYSPAGVVRGQIRNVTRLSYNPSKEQRDQLYSSRINPVATFPGEGTILYGDKTSLAFSSAFDRINVRKLFLIVEKEIAKISRSVLFEFNDQTTRSMFKNNVNPYLRDIKSRRGMTDFLVVCDESNNTPEIIDRNEFVADIYIKPSRSINFVTLNFVATKTGVTFSEAVGLFRR